MGLIMTEMVGFTSVWENDSNWVERFFLNILIRLNSPGISGNRCTLMVSLNFGWGNFFLRIFPNWINSKGINKSRCTLMVSLNFGWGNFFLRIFPNWINSKGINKSRCTLMVSLNFGWGNFFLRISRTRSITKE